MQNRFRLLLHPISLRTISLLPLEFEHAITDCNKNQKLSRTEYLKTPPTIHIWMFSSDRLYYKSFIAEVQYVKISEFE